MKKIKFVDIVILFAVVAALVVGYLTYKHFRQTADKQIESTSKIGFQVYLRGVTITGMQNPIKPGDETFISIRNVPYTNLKVINSIINTKKVVVPTMNPNQPFLLVDDYSQMLMYDIIVTVEDTAKITKDGAVVGGNKIKIGLPITLEGKDYKFNGTVSDVQILSGNSNQVKSIIPQPAQPAVNPSVSQQQTSPKTPQPVVGPQAVTPQPQKTPVPVSPVAKTHSELKK